MPRMYFLLTELVKAKKQQAETSRCKLYRSNDLIKENPAKLTPEMRNLASK